MKKPQNDDPPLLDVRGLSKHFPVQRGLLRRVAGYLKAVDGIDLSIQSGETVGMVGESGCGKSTVGRSLLRLLQPTEGEIRFRSRSLARPGSKYETVDVSKAGARQLRKLRQDMQIIFQDPFSSLDPRMNVAALIGEPLFVHGIAKGTERRDRVEQLVKAVGLSPEHMTRYPHEFSGGQRQRIGIARSLALHPQFIVADEPISALDVSIQAQIINLLQDLQEQFDLTYLVIGHDLSVVRYLCDRVAVMYLGKIVEMAPAEALFSAPKHPYSEALMSAVPIPDPTVELDQIVLEGDVPSPLDAPGGCAFHSRCRYAKSRCAVETPEYRQVGDNRHVACHFAESLSLRPSAGRV